MEDKVEIVVSGKLTNHYSANAYVDSMYHQLSERFEFHANQNSDKSWNVFSIDKSTNEIFYSTNQDKFSDGVDLCVEKTYLKNITFISP